MEVHFYMARTKEFNTKYSPEFKLSVILDMREHGLSYYETVRRFWGVTKKSDALRYHSTVRRWERIYLEEGAAGFMVERRGRTTKTENPNKGRPRKKSLSREVENDLIAENQRLKERLEYLEMENEYLKKLDALIRAEEQKKKQ